MSSPHLFYRACSERHVVCVGELGESLLIDDISCTRLGDIANHKYHLDGEVQRIWAQQASLFHFGANLDRGCDALRCLQARLHLTIVRGDSADGLGGQIMIFMRPKVG